MKLKKITAMSFPFKLFYALCLRNIIWFNHFFPKENITYEMRMENTHSSYLYHSVYTIEIGLDSVHLYASGDLN